MPSIENEKKSILQALLTLGASASPGLCSTSCSSEPLGLGHEGLLTLSDTQTSCFSRFAAQEFSILDQLLCFGGSLQG